jgi:hypothetical protein
MQLNDFQEAPRLITTEVCMDSGPGMLAQITVRIKTGKGLVKMLPTNII